MRREKDIMYEATNSSAATSHKAARMRVERPVAMLARFESNTVESRSGRRTESARASSGNLH